MKRVAVSGPSITDREITYVEQAVRGGWLEHANDFIQRFELAFSERMSVRHAVSLPSCTSGLHLALAALGVGAGDEVIVPECTWIATAAPVHYVGADVVFADICHDSWCLDVDSVAALIGPRTRAVIAVDLYGDLPDYAALRRLLTRHGIPLIEDAAEAAGSRWQSHPAGSLGLFGAFSFHGSKTMTTGEGGMLITDDEQLFARVIKLRDHGRVPGDIWFENDEVGFKYKMSALQAALGLAQLERLDELVAMKQHIMASYRALLSDLPGLCLNRQHPDVLNSTWMVTACWKDLRPDLHKREVIQRMEEMGISTRPFFSPLSSIPAYAAHPRRAEFAARNRTAYAVSPHAINLPSGLHLTNADIERSAAALRRALTA
jgi:perosamine synthetase